MMAAVKHKGSKAELALRRELHRRGLRYRLHAPELPGKPDLVFRRWRVAVFVDGDLWHGNPEEWARRGKTTLAEMFPTRTQWWVAKIERNIERDREVSERLAAEGWRVVRLWEHDVLTSPVAAGDRVVAELRAAGRH